MRPDCRRIQPNKRTGGGVGGYHALQVYEITGQVHPDHTDLYFGTQDNDLWASGDNGVTWPKHVPAEGFYIQMPHDSATDSGQTITATRCAGCRNFNSSAHRIHRNSLINVERALIFQVVGCLSFIVAGIMATNTSIEDKKNMI